MNPVNLIITGVGGQGVLLVTRVLAETASVQRLGVTVSEVHGMAQRGGAVVAMVRFGEAQSPLIGRGEANAILALEPMEALRVLDWASNSTVIVASTRGVLPLAVVLGMEAYPPMDRVFQQLMAVSRNVYGIDADKIANSLGSPVVQSVVLLGALLGTGVLPVEVNLVREGLAGAVPEPTLDVNLRALDVGYQITSQQRKSYS